MDRIKYPVRYLETKDFDTNGNIINPNIPKNIPIAVMIQSSGCHHCIKAKPAYSDFGKQVQNKCFVTALLVDGDTEGEKDISNMVKKIDRSITGFPSYVFYSKGKRINYEGNRQSKDLKLFLDSLEH
jgi:thiol-disulfide isomerase/thioredoxin